ncbi:coil containing protein [Vibrio phage 1.223.O._10N.261.48.A9]|nr:coil containing protein [Vibrio phage 1.223.O._10N.261.48.A9]
MAYSPSEKYPGAVDVDPDYQGGKFRDNNPSTTNNGSPLKAIDRNELLARDEAIMNDAGFEYNGLPDTPQDSQLFKAYKASLGNGANLLSNHNFLIQTPDDSQPLPSATPTSYPPGYQIFSGVFANETTGITNLTYIDGRVSFSGGDLYFAVPNAGALARVDSSDLVASVADFDGKPRTRGVSFALVGDEYRVTVGVDALEDETANATPLGSVKFEEGKEATKHETTEGLTAQTAGGVTNLQATSVQNMIDGKAADGDVNLSDTQYWDLNGTKYKCNTNVTPAPNGVGDFEALNSFNVVDYGAKGGDPSHDDYFGILAACTAMQNAGGGVLEFPLPAGDGTYYINQYRIDGGPDANGIVNWVFEDVPVIIKGNYSKLKMIGGWTRRQNNGSNSYDNCVGFNIRGGTSYAINLSIDGGAKTITKVAPTEGVSYGILYSGVKSITEKNIHISYYTTDGVSYSARAVSGQAYDYASCENCVCENSSFLLNGRQGASVTSLKTGTFTNVNYGGSGESPYGGHSPRAAVDVEPPRSPETALTTDVWTGELLYQNCKFQAKDGFPFVATGDVSGIKLIKGKIVHVNCTYDATDGSDRRFVTTVVPDGFLSINPTFVNCGIAPSFANSAYNFSHYMGGSMDINQTGFRMLTGGVNSKIYIDSMDFTYNVDASYDSTYILHDGTGYMKDCNVFIGSNAHPRASDRHTAVSFNNPDFKCDRIDFDTDISDGNYFYFCSHLCDVENEKYLNPSKISPLTSPYTQTKFSRGDYNVDQVTFNTGNRVFFGDPVAGQTYAKGDTAILSASSGGKGFSKCTTAGAQGVDAVFNLCGAID